MDAFSFEGASSDGCSSDAFPLDGCSSDGCLLDVCSLVEGSIADFWLFLLQPTKLSEITAAIATRMSIFFISSEIGELLYLYRLHLWGNSLHGNIPSEIGNLYNLMTLYLHTNQLTGEIPESICDLVLNWEGSGIHNNQLCPPYPSCIEDYVGEQDTSDCD